MNSKIKKVIDSIANPEGITQTQIKWVYFYKTSNPSKRNPQLYKTSILFIVNWHKKLYVEDRAYAYGNWNFLLVAVPTPIICETFIDNNEPFVGICIELDLSDLYSVIKNVDSQRDVVRQKKTTDLQSWILTLQMNSKIEDCLSRLVEACSSDLDSKILWQSIINEIIFHTIKNTTAKDFCDMILNNNKFSEFGKILETIHSDYSSTFVIEDMAKKLSMSISTFHRNFKAVTWYAPIQYIKNIRLNKAKMLLNIEKYSVKQTAQSIWYFSQSQFSREYKRYFGYPPLAELRWI